MKQRLKGLRGAVNLMDKTHLFGSLPERGARRWCRNSARRITRRSPGDAGDICEDHFVDLTDELPRVKAPTLLYWGAEDTETPL